MSESNETATKRLAVRPSIFEDMRDFSSGMDGNYSEVLEFMLRSFQKPNETAFEAGRRLREKFQKTHSGMAKVDKE